MTNLFAINTTLPRWWWLNPWKSCLALRQRLEAVSILAMEKDLEAKMKDCAVNWNNERIKRIEAQFSNKPELPKPKKTKRK